MGKSSSSRKKKSSKASSQARKRKRSKIRSRKHESKKLRHQFSDDEDSRSSTSGSSSYSSSSEDDKYRGKRSRIRARKDVKSSSKKRSRKHSYSSESSEDSPRASKRTGSKGKHDYENKNKTYSKKKRRRDYSTSSTSSGSWSCSTCCSDSSGSHEVESEKHRSKCGKEERDERILGKVESPSKRSRYRLRSPSRGRFSESSTYQNEEKVWVENNSRRLRSIVIVAERDKEDRELSKDEDEEEIIHDHGDYPPCRSSDSNDVGNKWEEGDHFLHNEVEKLWLESEKGDDTAFLDLRSNKHAKSGYISNTDDGSQFDGTVNIVNGDNLESVLRQRALENLRRFRGGLQTGKRTTANNDKSEGDAKQSSILNAESVQTRSNREDDIRVVGATFFKEDGAEAVISTEAALGKGIRVPLTGKDTTSSSKIDKNITNKKTRDNESLSVKQNVAYLARQMTITGNSKEKVSAATSIEQQKLAAPAFTRQFSKTCSPSKHALELESEEPQANLLLPKSSLDETLAVTALPVTQNSSNNNNNNNGSDLNNACSSAASEAPPPTSTSVETRPDKLKDEAHEGSQLEQKTMSVTRGGEMVKVSYSVYIPKKVPALARRQLKQ